MTSLSKLSLILIVVCIFIPAMILSITRGFQYFSLEKLSSFYAPFFVSLENPIDKPSFSMGKDPSFHSYYQDFILLKKGSQESPSLMRTLPMKDIETLNKEGNLLFLRGKNMKKGEILLTESLAINLGVDVGGTVEVFVFLPHNSFPIRKEQLLVSGIVSFQNATLDRTISLIIPKTLEKQFFIPQTKVNILMSHSQDTLKTLRPMDRVFSLQDMPSIKQMNQQYVLLLFLALTSSCLCFFALFMNLKTNLKNHLYSIHVLKILGLPEKTFVQSFFLQNIFLVIIGIILGILLSLLVIPHIAALVKGVQNFLNHIILFLRIHIKAFQNLDLIEFLPADVFYVREIPVKMAFIDFFSLSFFLLFGTILINVCYGKILHKNQGLEILQREQGI